MQVAPPDIWIVVVLVGVTILLGLHNPPRSWTGTVGPSLPGFTMASCVDSLLCYTSRQFQSLQYMYAFIHLHLSCLAHL
jgi:hypothetical protein